jgi:hypothetical protein
MVVVVVVVVAVVVVVNEVVATVHGMGCQRTSRMVISEAEFSLSSPSLISDRYSSVSIYILFS